MHPDVIRERQQKYLSTEKGYFKELWQSCRKSTHGCLFRNYEEFFECWEDQKKIYGMKCPYLGIEMTRIKGLNNGGKKTSEQLIVISLKIESYLIYLTARII